MATIISAGFSIIVLIVMFIFGLYGRRNIRWVVLSLIWGAIVYGLSYLLNREALDLGISPAVSIVILLPAVQQILAALGVLAIVHWDRFDNLVDGSSYGFASGLGYAICKSFEPSFALETGMLMVLSTTLVLATASAIAGVVMTQFYFRHRSNRAGTLLGGLSASTGYTILYNFCIALRLGGNILPIAFGVSGITLIGLYVTGQLRNILIQLGVEKKRAHGLLDIVIPIGVDLTTEKNFQRLLERMLVEAKNFCNADAGTLYLRKDDVLEYAVLRNDTLKIALGGVSGKSINLPPLHLHNTKTGTPNHHLIAAHTALSGKTINIPDAYDDEDYDFSRDKEFDERYKYASVSFLTIPLKNGQGEVQGVLQLVNAIDPDQKRLVPFDRNLQEMMESFSSLASAALEGYILEQNLRKEIQELRIEIDEVKRARQVNEIADSEYFKKLKQKTDQLKEKKKGDSQPLDDKPAGEMDGQSDTIPPR